MNKKNTPAKLLCVFVFLGCVMFGANCSFANENSYELTYRFKVGDQLRWKVMQQLRVKTSMEDKAEVVATLSVSTKLWTVTEVDADGIATIVHQVEEVDMHRQQTDLPNSSYNSKTDEEVPIGYEQVASSLNVPLLRLRIAPNGELVGRTPLVSYTLGTLDSKILVPLPKEKIRVGDTWRVPEEAILPQPNGTVKKVRLQKIFTLNSIRNDLAVISYKTERLSPIEEPKFEIQLFDKLTSGRVELDLKTGHILRQQTDVKGYVLGFEGENSSIDHVARLTEELRLSPESFKQVLSVE